MKNILLDAKRNKADLVQINRPKFGVQVKLRARQGHVYK